MPKPLVSFIMPVYNTEKYVARAIESVLSQTYQNFELILVNDGSTDSSGLICDSYAKQSTKIKVMHKENGGVSSARNCGLDAANGEYIQFIDSDDEIEAERTQKMVDAMIKYDVDVVFDGFKTVNEKKEVKREFCPEFKIYPRNKLLINQYIDKNLHSILLSSCVGMFKKSIIEINKLAFNTRYAVGEDGFFTLDYLKYIENACVLNTCSYYYYIYDAQNRANTVSYSYCDAYELTIARFEKMYSIICGNIAQQEASSIYQAFIDRLIAQMVGVLRYIKHYGINELYCRVQKIACNSHVMAAAKVYKRAKKQDSILIPFFLKHKIVPLLFAALFFRSKKLIKERGFPQNIKSIYTKQ